MLSIRYCDDSEHSCEAPKKLPATSGAMQIVVFTITITTTHVNRNCAEKVTFLYNMLTSVVCLTLIAQVNGHILK